MNQEWTATIVAGHQHAGQGPEMRGGPIKMLKMKEPPGICMKTLGTMTKCRATNTALYMKMHPLNDN